MSNVENFYADKTIFITGVTGFLGQVLLSKLLCFRDVKINHKRDLLFGELRLEYKLPLHVSCPDLRCIYILIREKKEKSIRQRFKEIFNSSVFELAKKKNPDYETKVKPIKGDCYQGNLGMSLTDRIIIETEVDIIFHVAANVRFDAGLREATYINVRSTDILLDIAKNMKNLKAFMYVSTAYSSCAERKLIEEKFYSPPMQAENLLTLVELIDDTVLNSIAPKLIKPHPNTYIYTKLVAENLCRQKGEGLPICIFRPAIVAPCSKEPVPGWINNSYGPVGAIVAYALGILKVARVNAHCKADMVPGDYCINALIVSGFYLSKYCENEYKFNTPRIHNYSNSTTNFTLTWKNFLLECDNFLDKYPFCNCVTFPSIILNNNSVVYRWLTVVLHLFPAFILDTILNMLNKKPRFIKLYQRIHKLFDILIHFSTNEWIIPNNNIDRIWAELSQKDKEIFYFNLNDLNKEEYFETYIRGLRLYIAHDEDHTIERAIKKRRMFFILQYVVLAIFILIFLYIMTFILFFKS